MNTSETSKLIEEKYTKAPLKLVYEGGKRSVYDPDEKLTGKALLKFCELWNKDEKSRGFVKHLVRFFVPSNPQNRVATFTADDTKENKDRCCIIGIKLAGVEDIAFGMKKFVEEAARIDAQLAKEGRKERTKEEKKYLSGILQALPVEIRNTTVAYVNPRSDKTLSGEAVAALEVFVKEMVDGGDEEMIEVTTPRPKKVWNKRKKGGNRQGIALGDMLSSDVLNKLYNITNSKKK